MCHLLGAYGKGARSGCRYSECAHSFHSSCVGNSGVACDNYLCPVCLAEWNDVPNSNTVTDSNSSPNPFNQVPESQVPVHSHVMDEPEPIRFSDDEPLLLPMVTADLMSSAPSADLQIVSINAIPERVAVASSESVSEFDVLITITGPPPLTEFPQFHGGPIDLVTVLDISGSMHGSKLALLKSAVVFFIDNLGPSHRLSIVSFSTHARRILPLRRMTEEGRENAKWCVNSLSARGSTNIVEALKKGVQVLDERRHQDPVSGIVLFSDGRDTCYRDTHFPHTGHHPQYLHLLPGSLNPKIRGIEDHDQLQTYPVYSLCFGTDHDPFSMHAISVVSGGSFSYIESDECVEEAFDSCIESLSTVIGQELHLRVTSASHGVRIRSISSKIYASEICNQGSRGSINVGNICADDDTDILINLSIPVFGSIEDNKNDSNTMHLLHITYSYTEFVSKQMVQSDVRPVTIRRPKSLSPREMTVHEDVDKEKNRLLAAESVTEALQMAETRDLTGARTLLQDRSLILTDSSSWLKDLQEKMVSRELYESDGRRCALEYIYLHGTPNMANKFHQLSKKVGSPPSEE
ncbi:E3 ubiquitin-protein ligase WAV3-like [Primulina eburnea]|uniref:E3 ubiquitin-protein ligase WAV3-like n=1 Tax=Primulina eburnea TaxID=1245227 RepID=UPI003C6C305D